jgi:hypothetical protein
MPRVHDSKPPAAHEMERLPRLTCSWSDTGPDQLKLVRAAHDLARDHLSLVLPTGRPLADTLVQLDGQEGGRLVALWRSPPTDPQRAALATAWNGLTDSGPESVRHLVQFPPTAGDL